MYRLGYILGFCVWAVSTSPHQFPSDIERCKYSDSDCISKVATDILHSYSSMGHSGLNIFPIDPLHVDNMVFEKIPDGPVSVELKFKDVDLTGIHDGTVLQTTGFKKEASDFVFEMKANYPKLVISGPYSIEGSVLNLPINGEGMGTITFEDIIVIAKSNCTKRQEDGETYLNILNAQIELQPKKVTFNFENLFNGNKAMSDNMNSVLNNSWDDVFSALKPLFEKSFAEVGVYIANATFSTIPYADLFLPSE